MSTGDRFNPFRHRPGYDSPPPARPRLNVTAESRGFDHLWTIADLQEMFDVTRDTVLNWRTRKKDPLPYINIRGNGRRNVIRFNRKKVLEWARRNGKQAKGLPEGGLLPIGERNQS